MRDFKLRKGNFFNQLTNSFDPKIIDGNQYDLELTIKDKKYYYQVRFIDSVLEAYPIKLKESEFFSPVTHSSMEEITSFFDTEFYHHEFEFYKELEEVRKHLKENDVFKNPDYFCFLKKLIKKNQLKGQSLYDFSVPANGKRGKRGVLAYDVSIECARNYYYLFFVKEAAEKNYPQSNKDLYFIYRRNDFINSKKLFEDRILELCIEKDLPVNLTSLIYLLSDGNLTLLDALYKDILNAKNKHNAELLIYSKYLPLLNSSLRNDTSLQNELRDFINTGKTDIEYNFTRKRV